MARQGTNYGLNSDFIYNEFELDSNNAFNSFNNSFSAKDWPFFVLGKPLNNIAAIKVIEVSIPFTYYTVQTPFVGPLAGYTSNTFYLSENGGANATVTIPPGNYDSSSYTLYTSSIPATAPISTSMPQQLAWALSDASIGNFIYNVVYYAADQKFIIYNNDTTSTHRFSISFNQGQGDVYNKMGVILGFTTIGKSGQSSSGTTTSSNNGTTNILGTTVPLLTAPYIAQLSGPLYLYLCSSILGPLVKLFIPSSISGMAADGPQIAKIPVNVNSGFTIDWQDPDTQKWFNMNNLTNLQQLDLYITFGSFSDFSPLLFNGAAFSVKLGILQSEITQQANVGGGYQNSRVTTSVGPIT